MILFALITFVLVVVSVAVSRGPSFNVEVPTADSSGVIGKIGVADETFSVKGKVLVNGELWGATAQRGIIQKGEQVKIVSIQSELTLVVERMT